MKNYAFCGLLLCSDFDLPELAYWPNNAKDPDVIFIRDNTPLASYDNESTCSLLVQPHNERTWRMWLPGIGAIAVIDERDVRIVPTHGSKRLSMLALIPLLSFLACQRGYLVLRATVIEYDSVGLLILGAPGIGKSTTACALLKYGFTLISDGISIIDAHFSSVSVRALATSPYMGLWHSGAKLLNIELKGAGPCGTEIEKILVKPFPSTFNATSSSLIRNAIFLSRGAHEADNNFKLLESQEIASRLMRSCYLQHNILKELNKSEFCLSAIKLLSKSLNSFVISTSNSLFDVKHILDIIS